MILRWGAAVVYVGLSKVSPITLDDLATLTGRSRRSVQYDLAELIALGLVERVGKPSRYTTPTYRLLENVRKRAQAIGPTTKQGETMTDHDPLRPADLLREPGPDQAMTIGQRAAALFRQRRSAVKGAPAQPGMVNAIGGIAKQMAAEGCDEEMILRAVDEVARNVKLGPGSVRSTYEVIQKRWNDERVAREARRRGRERRQRSDS